MNKSELIIQRSGPVQVLAINDAPYNRMSLALMDCLEDEVKTIAEDDEIRAVVITGAGDENFSVGMNLKEIMSDLSDRGGLDGVLDQRLRVLSAIENMDKPWIATLYGYCLGGGFELPLACHFRLAAETGAQIGLPEFDLGTVPAWGGSARLSKRFGREVALDMVLRARKISGPDALQRGMVSEVWPLTELKDRAIALAEELAAMPRVAVKGMLTTIVGCEDKTLEKLIRQEREAVQACRNTADQAEGMMAFVQKRKPVFNQR